MSVTTEVKRAFIYCRMSRDQSGEGLGVERQETALRALAAQKGWTVAHIYVDNDVSASTGKPRPKYTSMLKDLEEGRADAVLVWDLDRLTRRPIELEHFMDLADRKRIDLASVGDDFNLASDNGRLFARIKGAVARAEVERKSARQKSQQDQRREGGRHWWSQRPFGYEWSPGALDISLRDDEASLIREGYDMLDRGTTYVAVCEHWKAAGSRGVKGDEWTPVTVRQVLQNRRNASQVVRDGQPVGRGNWPEIISPERFDAIMGRAGNPAMKGLTTGKRKAMLSGLVTCGVCGLPLQQRSRGSQARGVSKIYRPACGHVSAPVAWLDEYVSDCVLHARAPFGRGRSKGPARDLARLRKSAERLGAKLSEVNALYAADKINGAQLADLSKGIRDELDPLELTLALAERHDPVRDTRTFAELRSEWRSETQDLATRRAIIRSLFPTITVHPRAKGSRMSPNAVVVLDVAGEPFKPRFISIRYGE